MPFKMTLCSKASLMLLEDQLYHMRASQCPFLPGCQASELLFILRRTIELSVAWLIPAYTVDEEDIHKVYGATKHAHAHML
jgi:hypothetical protein